MVIILKLETRLFEIQDLNKIDELLNLFEDLGYPTNEKDLRIRLKKLYAKEDYFLLLLIKDDQIIGLSGMCKMMFYEKNDEYMRLLAFVINSSYRRNGYGKILLKKSEALSIELGCKVITLNSGNRIERKNAHKFYKINGFENTSSGFYKRLN